MGFSAAQILAIGTLIKWAIEELRSWLAAKGDVLTDEEVEQLEAALRARIRREALDQRAAWDAVIAELEDRLSSD